MLGTEEVLVLAFQVHDADEAVLGDEGDGQLGAHVGIGGDVEVRGGDVVEEDGLAGERDLTHNTFADGNAGALDLGRVADLEAHAQIVRALIKEKNGEDAIRDEGANELGCAGKKGLQVERGVERVGETHEVGDVGGLDAGIDGVEISGRVSGGRGFGRAIVAFEVVRRRWRSVGHVGSKE